MLPGPDEYVLVVEDDPEVRELLVSQMAYLGHACRQAGDAEEAVRIARANPAVSLVLSDVHLPGASGVELLHHLKKLNDNTQVVMITGLQDLDTVQSCLREGAYDYLEKPVELDDLSSVVSKALERSRLLRENELYRANLERLVLEKTTEIRQTRDIAMMTLAKLAESRDTETGVHLDRMAAYSRRLAKELQKESFPREVDPAFIEQLYKSSPLHDIGKVGIPDSILLKPGPLTPDEIRIMQTHPTIGGDTLRSVIEQYEAHTFLRMGMEIAYSHHERWDGSGYPNGIAGEGIPLSARIVALADAYDTITSDRPYKKAFDHTEAVRRVLVDRELHFDPVVVDAFTDCHTELPEIRARLDPQSDASGRTTPGGPSGSDSGAQAD